MSQKVVVIYSGGMDSFTVLNKALEQGHEVSALSFNYGQRHVRELDVAAKVCDELSIPHKVVDITAINTLLAGSSLTDDIEIPEGHYEESSMKSTVVPNRNMILLSLAIGYAVSEGASAVYYGAHSGDHAIYPDCRPEFVRQMNVVSQLANYEPIEVVAPYLDVDKNAILADGLRMALDYSNTWTCYNGRDKACGKCGACVERLEAFAANGVKDPLPYEA
ncbi:MULTISPECIES: 7-cyano-7-deazaguanine synthase QueC [unclassified Idiomarina]|jgi:7-cyano-7-deazaguanine synthase|uniref:7-cyano-7-deazaguanine synthase QueC n=1 Tax=unclassified Idiomarina TaxID=2614829 RepID=UPI000C923B27|nr:MULTISPECIES: 7-cyano-7-deazaguanine synthase QueC [unclassified Idiomarina]MAD53972.1 7-cyano-7-deazaguanine synthase QueC [Idiomarinaceae bacterium]MEC7644273.1 7-cyano-7-deazaguanine synthase QueC [Pseudomonadota bacterium]NQZ03794.1 7-cyano-7-deazaguanine synthase QueC [Idiomarina sp.]|tara:strand:+ start:4783 stop:5442 length:660 start_codon:yes stop_codon:yes gene_type:complete